LFCSYKGVRAADFRNLEDFAKYPEVSIAATCGGIP
jgi:hypothetical protein